jgi:GTP pyrophosphokinase
VPNLGMLGRLLARIGQLPNVIEAWRNRQENRA